jgi:hypothetical protein
VIRDPRRLHDRLADVLDRCGQRRARAGPVVIELQRAGELRNESVHHRAVKAFAQRAPAAPLIGDDKAEAGPCLGERDEERPKRLRGTTPLRLSLATPYRTRKAARSRP